MIWESEQYHQKFKCASVLDRKIKHPQESQQFVIKKISGIVLLQYKFCLNSVFGPNDCKTTQVSNANFFMPNTNVGSYHFLRFRDGKCFQASQNGKRRTFSLVSGAKIRNSTIIPDQCKVTLDVADSNGWIPFAQNADTIEKAIVAKQTPQLHPATEICISAPPNPTVFH